MPLVHELQDYQRTDGSVEPRHHAAAAQALSALRDELRDSALFSEPSLDAPDHDLAKWRAAGLESAPCFDASRDVIEGPGDKELALFAGPAFMPNSDTRAPLFQLVLVMRDEPDSLRSVREDYPHPESMCQMIRVLTGSRQAKEGQCVVLFPENVQASTKITRQKFAWFFMNKHIPTYRWTLAQIRERCGESLFSEGESLASPKLDAEGIYDTRCCWLRRACPAVPAVQRRGSALAHHAHDRASGDRERPVPAQHRPGGRVAGPADPVGHRHTQRGRELARWPERLSCAPAECSRPCLAWSPGSPPQDSRWRPCC